MAIKPKKGKVNGTFYSDYIKWKNKGNWKRALKVYGYDGDDYINFKKSSYKKNKIYGGNGNDTILGGKNIDYIYGGLDNDTIYGYNGNDKLYGEYGNDIIFAGKGNDYVDGGFGDDIIYGQSGKNTLIGGFGNDVIYCGTGTEKIYGNQGNDTIVISKGTKNVYFNLGDGHDTIYNYGGTVNLRFGYWVNVTSNSKYDENGNYNFVISYGNMGDTISIANINNLGKMYYYVGGTKYAVSSLLKKGVTIKANDNGGTIVGSQFDDFIVSGKGNDVIDGKNGSDIYVFSSGDGHDVIEPSRNGLDNDVIRFTEQQNLTYHKPMNSYDLIIKYNNDQDSITMKNYFMSMLTFPKKIINGNTELNLENELNTNLIIVEGTDESNNIYGLNASSPRGNDIIYGYGGDDFIEGGLGNDIIIGGTGNDTMTVYNKDTFVFNIGDGNDIIDLGETNYDYNIQKKDAILKFNDVAYTDLQYQKSGNDIVIKYSENDTVTLKNYLLYVCYNKNSAYPDTDAYDYTIVDKNNTCNVLSSIINPYIESIGRIDGTIYSDTIVGSEGNDIIYGGLGNDIIYGNGGNDRLNGEDGDDIIYAGSGENYVDGGKGNDTIYAGNGNNIIGGAGNDTIYGQGTIGTISGGAGNDTIYGQNATNISGGDDDDIIYCNRGGYYNGDAGYNTYIVDADLTEQIHIGSNHSDKRASDIVKIQGYTKDELSVFVHLTKLGIYGNDSTESTISPGLHINNATDFGNDFTGIKIDNLFIKLGYTQQLDGTYLATSSSSNSVCNIAQSL